MLLNDEIVTAIEFDEDGKMRQVFTEKSQYYTNWCKAYNVHLLYDGGDIIVGNYWSTINVEKQEGASQIETLPKEIEQWLEEAWEVEDTVYCNITDDYYPDDPDLVSRHLRWIEDWGEWGGCGTYPSDWKEHKESFFKVLDKVGVDVARSLQNSLKNHDYYFGVRGAMLSPKFFDAYLGFDENGVKNRHNWGYLFTDDLTDQEEEEMSIGVQWLLSLWSGDSVGKKVKPPFTEEADIATAKWIDEWLQLKI